MKPFWKRLGRSKHKIKAVAMDMSEPYRKAVSTHLNKAKIVFDHFHVVKLFNDKLSDLRRRCTARRPGRAEEGPQGNAVAVAEGPENLDPKRDEKDRLEEALKLNKPLATAYYLKEDLRQFWDQPGKTFAGAFLRAGSHGRRPRESACCSRWPRRWRSTVRACWRTTTT